MTAHDGTARTRQNGILAITWQTAGKQTVTTEQLTTRER